jgi:hypothetical protein
MPAFGVPYATHIWQVADASSLNGAYKVELAKAKLKYIEKRETPKFEPTDIVPWSTWHFQKVLETGKMPSKPNGVGSYYLDWLIEEEK